MFRHKKAVSLDLINAIHVAFENVRADNNRIEVMARLFLCHGTDFRNIPSHFDLVLEEGDVWPASERSFEFGPVRDV